MYRFIEVVLIINKCWGGHAACLERESITVSVSRQRPGFESPSEHEFLEFFSLSPPPAFRALTGQDRVVEWADGRPA